MVASGSDTVASKAAKFLIGSVVPVVGGALSDAFGATQGYLRLLKATVGVFGILIALMTFLPVFLQTVLWYFTVNLAGADVYKRQRYGCPFFPLKMAGMERILSVSFSGGESPAQVAADTLSALTGKNADLHYDLRFGGADIPEKIRAFMEEHIAEIYEKLLF